MNINLNDNFTITTEAYDIGERADVFAVSAISTSRPELNLTRSAVQRLIENGDILINDNVIKSNYKIRGNDVMSVSLPAPAELDIPAENIPLEIVYENNGMLIINKPRGIVVHPAPGHYTGTIVNALMFHFGSELSGINGALRPGIIHRLDMDTSGVLAIAKNDFFHQSLSLQLATREMSRKYKTLLHGNIKDDEGEISNFMGRNPHDRKKMAVLSPSDRSESKRSATTRYRVISRLFYKNKSYTFIEASLVTGRTHQIRVHMAHIGHPVVGDVVYGIPAPSGFPRLEGQLLHAETIGFTHPETGEKMSFSAPIPNDFSRIIEIIS